MHEVLRVLADRARTGSQPGRRDDGFRVALAAVASGEPMKVPHQGSVP